MSALAQRDDLAAPGFGAPILSAEAETLFESLRGEPRLLVAVSGGPDSVALLALLAEWASQPGRPTLAAATVDHGLRAGSDIEAQGVAALCRTLALPHAILRWSAPRPLTGIQRRARQARYALLCDHAQTLGGAVLVTAHTLDDQAETVLMRMARGSGPDGLAGMRERTRKGDCELARPLLGIEKRRLLATLEARGLGFVADPSNRDSRFERVRWRALMPALAEGGLDAARLATLAHRIARMEAALSWRVEALWPELILAQDAASLSLRLSRLRDEPDEIVLRVVAKALEIMAGEIHGHARLERLESCVEALIVALRDGAAITRTLSGCVLSLGCDGRLILVREGPRRRGVHSAAS